MNLIHRLAQIHPRVTDCSKWWVNWEYKVVVRSTGRYDGAGFPYPRFELKKFDGDSNRPCEKYGFAARVGPLYIEMSTLQPFRVREMLGRITRSLTRIQEHRR